MIHGEFEDAWIPCQNNSDCKSGLVCTQKPIQYNTISSNISATNTGLPFTQKPIQYNATSSNTICVCPQYGMTIHMLNVYARIIAKPIYLDSDSDLKANLFKPCTRDWNCNPNSGRLRINAGYFNRPLVCAFNYCVGKLLLFYFIFFQQKHVSLIFGFIFISSGKW